MWLPTWHEISDSFTGAIAGSSIVFRFIPPPETYNDWPRLQGWYKLFYVTVRFVAVNKSNGGTTK